MQFETFKELLVGARYPHIATFSDEQIAEVFSDANNNNFLTWFLKLWAPEELENNLNMPLWDMLCNHGFFSTQDKLAILNKTIKPATKIQIYLRMLHNLNIINSQKYLKFHDEDEEYREIDVTNIYDLDEFNTSKIDLFPNYAGKKQFKDVNECDEHYDKLMSYIDESGLDIEELVQSLGVDYDEKPVDEEINGGVVDIKDLYGELKIANDLFCLKINKMQLDEWKKMLKDGEKNVEFKDGFEETLKVLVEEAILYARHKNCMEKLNAMNLLEMPPDNTNEYDFDIEVAELTELIKQILK